MKTPKISCLFTFVAALALGCSGDDSSSEPPASGAEGGKADALVCDLTDADACEDAGCVWLDTDTCISPDDLPDVVCEDIIDIDFCQSGEHDCTWDPDIEACVTPTPGCFELDEADCSERADCAWELFTEDGQFACQESLPDINCNDIIDEDLCAASGCLWDELGCTFDDSCWSFGSEDECESFEGCDWVDVVDTNEQLCAPAEGPVDCTAIDIAVQCEELLDCEWIVRPADSGGDVCVPAA